ncbi:MAG: hypothetical protein R2807_04785 [Chitinophagales bacterium]
MAKLKQGAPINAQNAINLNTTTPNASAQYPYVELGGALVRPTVISGLTSTNTLSFTGTGQNAFSVEGSTFSVDVSNNRVGIGTTIPSNTLNVNNAGTTGSNTDSYPLGIQRSGATDLTLGSDGSYALMQSWNGKPLLINTQGNNVGIGTTSAPSKLTVNGTIEALDFTGANGRNIIVGDDAFLSDVDAANTIGLISMTNATLGTLRLGNNSAANINGMNGNLGLKTTTNVQEVNIGGRMYITNGVIQTGGTAVTGTSDLGLYSRTSGNYIRIVTNNAPVNFYSDDNTGTSINVSITNTGVLEAQKGFRTERHIRFYRRSRGNGGGGVDNLGNYDFCYLAGVAFRNSDSVSDEDDDYQCNVYSQDINGNADYDEGENTDYSANFGYTSRPYWRMYSECYQDCSNSTCTAICINFDY